MTRLISRHGHCLCTSLTNNVFVRLGTLSRILSDLWSLFLLSCHFRGFIPRRSSKLAYTRSETLMFLHSHRIQPGIAYFELHLDEQPTWPMTIEIGSFQTHKGCHLYNLWNLSEHSGLCSQMNHAGVMMIMDSAAEPSGSNS